MNKISKINILSPVAFHLEVFYVTHGMRLMYFMIAVWQRKITCLTISDFFHILLYICGKVRENSISSSVSQIQIKSFESERQTC